MGNNGISEEEIKRFVEDGWSFRVKKSGNRHYITRRKGQRERSLGPYNEELWDMLQRIKKMKKGPIATVSAFQIKQRDLDNHLKMERGAHYMRTCLFIDKDQFCTFYRYQNKPESYKIEDRIYTEGLSKIKELTVNGKTEQVWVHRANIPFCAACSAFFSIEHIRRIQS